MKLDFAGDEFISSNAKVSLFDFFLLFGQVPMSGGDAQFLCL
jgi:hypothetical protein